MTGTGGDQGHLGRRYRLFAALLILVALAAGGMWVFQNGRAASGQRSVAAVNGESISLADVRRQTRYAHYMLADSARQIYGSAPVLEARSSRLSATVQALQQIQQSLAPVTLKQNALARLVEDRLIRQEAWQRNITVSAEEIERALQESFGYYAAGTPTARAAIPTSTFTAQQLALLAPAFTPAAAQTSAPQPEMTEGTPPAAAPLTEQGYQALKEMALTELVDSSGLSEADLRQIIEAAQFRQKVMQVVLAEMDLQAEQEQVWARHILLAEGQEQLAQELHRQVEAGADFCALVASYSIDLYTKNNCGAVDWFPKGQYVPAFEEAAFTLQIGEISQPVKIVYGWDLIQVLGHEVRPLAPAKYQQLQQEKFNAWLETLKKGAEIEISEGWQAGVPDGAGLPDGIERYIEEGERVLSDL